MKKLFRNSLIASVVAVAGVVGGAGASFGQTATLNLGGATIDDPADSCQFDQDSYTNNSPLITTNSGVQADIRWQGSFDVNCNDASQQLTISVDSVTPIGQVVATRASDEYFGEYLDLEQNGNTSRVWGQGGTPEELSATPFDQGTINYDFSLDTDPNGDDAVGLAPGDYGYTIEMTAVPQ